MFKKALLVARSRFAGCIAACAGEDAAQRRAAQVRGGRRAAQLRLPRELVFRVHSSGAAALQHAAQVRQREVSGDQGRPRRVVDGGEGRPHLHLQAAQGREVPRRHDLQRRKTSGRPTIGCASRPPGVLSLRQATYADIASDRDARSVNTVVFKLSKAQCVDARELREPVGLRLQRGAAQEGPEVSRAQHHGHRAFHLRRARRRLALARPQVQGLLRERQAASRTAFSRYSSPARRW